MWSTSRRRRRLEKRCCACTGKKQDGRPDAGVAELERRGREEGRPKERRRQEEKERKSRNDPGVAVALSTGPLVGIKPGVGAVAVPASSSAGPFSTSTTIIATTTTTIATTSGKSSSTSIATSAEVARLLALGASVKPGTDSRSRTRRVRVVLGVLLIPVRIWSACRFYLSVRYLRSRAVFACRPFARHAVIQCDSTAGGEGVFERDVDLKDW